MARDPSDVYDDWYLKQEEKVDEFIDTIDDPEDPREKLKRYDRALEKAEALLLECRKREAATEGLYENSKDAQEKLDDLIKDKEQYLSEWFEEELAEYLEDQKERQEAKREAAKAQKKRNLAKERILATFMERKEITLVELEKIHPDFKDQIRAAVVELDGDGLVERFKIKNRLAVKLKSKDGLVNDGNVAKAKEVRKPKKPPQQAPERSKMCEFVENDEKPVVFDEGEKRARSGFSDFAAKEKSLSGSEKKPEGKGSTFLLTAIIFAVIVYFVFF